MASKGLVVLGLFLLIVINSSSSIATNSNTHATYFNVSSFNRNSFPAGFIFGASSAAYQVEGAASEGGRGPSMWDYYAHKYPEKITDHSNGDVAIDQYHRYKEDVRIMKNLNMDAYRFSISWPRLLPNGKLNGGLRKEGIDYYNNLINETIAKGITPFVTIFHWDVPQALEEEFGGFLNRKIVSYFEDYVELCFKLFGDRVKHWITLNEPHMFSSGGYATAMLAPWRCSEWQKRNCTGGDSGTEPYKVTHNLLLSHAKAVKIYRDKFQASQKGVIGITLDSGWVVPYDGTEHNKKASLRALDFAYGWFMDPLTYGDYPQSMRDHVKNRLPTFSEDDSKLLKGSYDFVGLNYYASEYAKDYLLFEPLIFKEEESYTTDDRVQHLTHVHGIPIGDPTDTWIYVSPKGIYDLLVYTKTKYNDPVIYITENGYGDVDRPKTPIERSPFNPSHVDIHDPFYGPDLNDTRRVDYHLRHLENVQKAINDHDVKVKGYFAWSMFDSYEWRSGYTVRFGINYVDYNDGLKRYPKLSAYWFQAFLEKS